MIVVLLMLLSITICGTEELLLPTEFGAVYFGTVVGKTTVNLAVVGEIYLSKKQSKGVFINRRAFDISYEIFDYKSKEVLIASGDGSQCEVKSIKTFTEGVDPKVFIDTMIKKLEKSKNQTDFNGIPAFDWLIDKEIVATYADSYWNFSPSFGNWSRPLFLTLSQVEMIGKVNYNYYFMDVFDKVPQELFVPPHGILCPGFNSSRQTLPLLSDKFRVNIESISNFTKNNSKIFYDNEAKVIRKDFLIGNGKSYSIITDQNHGINYKIDYDSGRCISTSALDLSQLSTPNQLIYELGNKSNFYYRGTRSCFQGICEVWSGASDYSIHEIHFKKIASNYIPIQMDTQPISDYPITGFPTTFHYFDYENDYSDWTKFDVSNCYDEEYKLKLQVSLKGDISTIADIRDFQREFRLTVGKFTKAPQIRMHKLRMDNFNNEFIFVTFTLLEEPKTAGFNASETFTNFNSYVYVRTSDAITGGNFIVKTNSTSGVEIAFMGAGISKKLISEDIINKKGTSLLKFKRNENREFKIETSDLVIEENLTIDSCAKQCDREQRSKCDLFMFCGKTQRCVLSTTLFEDRNDTVTSSNCDIYIKDYGLDFDLTQRYRLPFNPKTDIKVSDIELRDCFSQCLHGKLNTTSCHSIDFCTNGQHRTCIFHALHLIQVNQKDVVSDQSCLHYSMNYLSMFNVFPNKSIKDSTEKYIPIKYDVSVRDCAKNCMSDVAGCTDFEMCTLFRGSTRKTVCHIMEAKTSTTGQKVEYENNPECDHYRLKGLKTDFDFGNLGTDKPSIVVVSTKATKIANPIGYKPGEMAALAVSMLIVGVAIGFFAVYFYAKKQYTKGNGDNFIMYLVND